MENKYYEEYIELNGLQQYLLHYPQENAKAIVLYLHGDPGSSVSHLGYYIDQLVQVKDVSVVYWDQRGAGKTFGKNKKIDYVVEVDEMVEDTFQVVKHLKKVYDVDKIIILGHSWGSVLGTQFVVKHPEDVLAYIGVGQVIDMVDNKRVGYDKVKEEIKKAGNQKDLNKLMAIGEYPDKKYSESSLKKIMKVRKLQGKYGLAVTPNINLYKLMLKSPIFKVRDIFDILSSQTINKGLFPYLMEYKLTETTYQIPVYYLLGSKDFQTPTSIAVSYFKDIQAPRKELFLIEGAGHDLPLTHTKEFFETIEKIVVLEEEQSKMLSK